MMITSCHLRIFRYPLRHRKVGTLQTKEEPLTVEYHYILMYMSFSMRDDILVLINIEESQVKRNNIKWFQVHSWQHISPAISVKKASTFYHCLFSYASHNDEKKKKRRRFRDPAWKFTFLPLPIFLCMKDWEKATKKRRFCDPENLPVASLLVRNSPTWIRAAMSSQNLRKRVPNI